MRIGAHSLRNVVEAEARFAGSGFETRAAWALVYGSAACLVRETCFARRGSYIADKDAIFN